MSWKVVLAACGMKYCFILSSIFATACAARTTKVAKRHVQSVADAAPVNLTKEQEVISAARARCGIHNGTEAEIDALCHTCDESKNRFPLYPNEEEHRARNNNNFCPASRLSPLESVPGFAGQLIHRYHFVDEMCNCWTLLPIVKSVFHRPDKNFKLTNLMEGCSSHEVELPRANRQEDGTIIPENGVFGSFNFYDPEYSKMKHTIADVLPCRWGPAPKPPCRPLQGGPLKGTFA